MAQAGEIEVFRISPEVGKCYQHIEATRDVIIGLGERRYFSTNTPLYVGKFVRHLRYGYGNGGETHAIFNKGGDEIIVKYSYAGNTCFIEVPCLENTILSKARNQEIRRAYELMTKQSAAPGSGAADLIREFAGTKVPKGAEGGRRKYKRSSKRKHSKKRKTRSRK